MRRSAECLEHVLQELPRRLPVGLLDEPGDREFAGSVDAREQGELSLRGLHLGDIDVEEPDRLAVVLGPMADAARRLNV
jgi:hypothetical protein